MMAREKGRKMIRNDDLRMRFTRATGFAPKSFGEDLQRAILRLSRKQESVAYPHVTTSLPVSDWQQIVLLLDQQCMNCLKGRGNRRYSCPGR